MKRREKMLRFGTFVAVAVLMAAALPGAVHAQRQVPQSRQEIQLSYAPLVKRVAPAVVNIFTTKTVTTRRVSPLFDDPFFRRFFGDTFNGPTQQRRQNSLGSGVIVASSGVVVTNYHVIEGADEITVILADRREFDARIVGADQRTDLAVLQIEGGATFPHLEFRDSDDLEVGDLVLAIGNPFGVGQTVTSGIVSALARTQVGINDLNFFIQTDAAINPGNSGGALVTMDGRLVGINSAIYSKTGASVGIGFAIPSNMVRAVLSGITEGGRVVRPWIGAEGQAVTSDIAGSLGLQRPAGVLINGLYPKGPAEQAGLKVGDVILSIDGHNVDDPEALRFRIATRPVGKRIDLVVWREGKEQTLSMLIERPPEKPRRDTSELAGIHPLQGATVANLSPALADELGLSTMMSGVIVLEIRRGSAARRIGLRPGDIVREINGAAITNVRELKKVLLKEADKWRLAIERGGRRLSMVINR